MTVWAWVGFNGLCLAGGEVSVPVGVDGVGLQGTPRRTPGRGPESGPARAGELGPAGEGPGLSFPWRQAGVLDQRPAGGEPSGVAGLGEDRGGADRR